MGFSSGFRTDFLSAWKAYKTQLTQTQFFLLCTVIHIASIMQWMIYVAFAVAILQPLRTHALPSGAPTSVCSSLVPAGHSVGAANDAPGGYFVDTSLRDTNFAFNASTEYTSMSKSIHCNSIFMLCCSYSLRQSSDVSRVRDPST